MQSISKFILFLSLNIATLGLHAQSSMRLEKPQNKFFFVGLNTQIKSLDVSSGNKSGFEFSNYNTRNQLLLQFQIKNKKLLQRGYTKNIAFNSLSTTLNTETDVASTSRLGFDAFTRLRFRLNLLANFATKWDRTNFSIGTRSLPYGHNPRVDGFFSFMPTQARADLGMNNDMGVFFRTPLSEKWDLEAAATLGGYLRTPILGTHALNGMEANMGFFQLNKETYKGSFLLTGRVGTPVFKKNEFGIYSAIGQIVSPFQKDKIEQMVRIGGDYSHKFRDGFKFTQQASFGTYHTVGVQNKATFSTLNLHSGIDALFFGRVLTSATSSFRVKIDGATTPKNGTALASVGYVFNPNTQIRTNFFVEYDDKPTTATTYGGFIQLIAGLGQR
jgi:hypothetical protein